jgi:hypothetical protein
MGLKYVVFCKRVKVAKNNPGAPGQGGMPPRERKNARRPALSPAGFKVLPGFPGLARLMLL